MKGKLIIVFLALVRFAAQAQDPVLSVAINDSAQYTLSHGVNNSDQGFSFDGKSAMIEINSKFEIQNDFSLSFWINPQVKDGQQTIIMKGEDCPDGNANFNGLTFLIVLTEELSLSGVIYSGEGKSITESLTFITRQKLLPNLWQHIYITFDLEKVGWNVFFDGAETQLDESLKKSGNGFHLIANSRNATWKIGALESYCGYVHRFENFFLGRIKDINIYDYKRSDEEIWNEVHFELSRKLVIINVLLILTLIGSIFILAIQYQRKSQFLLPRKWLTVIILSILFFFFYKSQIELKDTAFFGGDTWEYQSMAINYCLDFGIQKFGGLATFDQYKFDRHDPIMYNEFYGNGGSFNVYRTPGYPFILGLFYKVAGPHPLLAKYLQLLLLCIISGTLPLMGMTLFYRRGFYVGLFGGVFLLNKYAVITNEILTEVVFSFSLYVVCWLWILFWRKKSLSTAISLGASIGFSLLIKGSVIFLPFLILFYFAFYYYKTKEARIIKLGLVIFVFVFFAILPWSIYASQQADEVIFLSTQTRYIVLDGNNELSADGDWHPEWHKGENQEDFIYNNKEFENKGTIASLIRFYQVKPYLIIPNFIGKMNRAFSEFVFHSLYICCLLFITLQNAYLTSRPYKMILIVSFILSIALSLFMGFGKYTYLFTTGGLFLVINQIINKTASMNQIQIMYLLFINFFILSALTYGNPRFVEVIDFVYIVMALHTFMDAFDKMNISQTIFKRGI